MLIVGILLTLFLWVGARVNVASAAAMQCLPLSGDTQPVIDAQGYMNSGAMYFGQYAAGRATVSPWWQGFNIDKPVYYAPDANVACASKINGVVYLQGWVWNDNLGWVSLYCPGDGTTNRGIACGGVKYGIELNPATSVFSGYAWSNAGWVRMGCLATPTFGDTNYCATSKHQITLNPATGVVPTPPYKWADPVLDKDSVNAWAWTGTPQAPQGTGAQWMSFAGMKVPLNALIDQQCALDPDSCLKDPAGVVAPVDPDVVPVDNTGPISDDVGVPGQFPVGIREVAYLNSSPSATGALNPVTQAQVRNLVYKNVLKWKKSASTSCGDGGNFLLQYQTNDSVFYCKGDIHLKAGSKWKGNKTLIVEGNVFVEGSLSSEKGQLGIVVLRSKLTNQGQGNVYVGPYVRDLHAQIYADGSVYPYVVGSAIGSNGIPVIYPANYAVVSDNNSLFGQLFIQGMIIANNYASTEGANLDDEDVNLGEQLRSLGYLRSSPGFAGSISDLKWPVYFNAWTKQTGGKITIAMSPGADPEVYAFGFVNSTEGLKSFPYVLDPNYVNPQTDAFSVYMSYEPPAQDLPVFDGITGSSLKQTGG